MRKLSTSQVKTKALDHLGLLASVIKEIGLVEKIDALLPIAKSMGAKVTMGERVAAMILNGLGFVNNRLYMFSEFLEKKPVDRLLGSHLKASYFTDDALGRCLDEIYEYGVTPLFSNLAFSIGVEQNLLGKSIHLDTTTLSVHGEYEKETEGPRIAHGFSKDHRPDLKQMVVNLATTGKAGFPMWMEVHSGNASDKKILHESAQRIKNFCEQLKESPSFLYVADSAMYESCVKKAGDLLWLSRVPERSKVVKEFIQQEDDIYNWQELPEEGYRMHVEEKIVFGCKQRWILISSQKAYNREKKTLDKNIDKELTKATKELWHLHNKPFSCTSDAEKALAFYKKGLKYHIVSEESTSCVATYIGRGRPKKGKLPKKKSYHITGKLALNEEKVRRLLLSKGRFILATNQLDKIVLPDEEILREYKNQQKTETGFRFIKNNTFQVSSVFLKKQTRIAALMMIMTLCLMVYSLAQHKLRTSLVRSGESIPDQLRKPTQKPSASWVFHLFYGIQVLQINRDIYSQELITNLTPLLKQIIRHFGPHAQKTYDITLPMI